MIYNCLQTDTVDDFMKHLSEKIENIILQHGERGMDRLRESMEPGYCRRAAQMILDNPGGLYRRRPAFRCSSGF